MEKKGKVYEAPQVKIYRFDDRDLILTASGETTDPTQPTQTAEYAANALNDLFGGTNTTIEK